MKATRRTMLGLIGGAAVLGIAGQARAGDALDETLAAVAARLGGRVGLSVRAEGREIRGFHGDERFAMCSTFKAAAAAALLARVDRGEESLDRRVAIGRGDLIEWSPVTEKRIGPGGMPLGELCEAAIAWSDNTAANCILEAIGGPAGLTAFLRGTGDDVTRLDRNEPTLNEAAPGDPRDTTSPAAMAATLERLAFGSVLAPASRARLLGWMRGDRVADGLFRAGMPKDWVIADKTGSGNNGARGIIAVVERPKGPALTIALYFAETKADMASRNAAAAEIGAAIARVMG